MAQSFIKFLPVFPSSMRECLEPVIKIGLRAQKRQQIINRSGSSESTVSWIEIHYE